MASIQKYKTNKDETRYRVMWRDNGKLKSKSFDRSKIARDFKAKLEHELREGTYVAPAKITLQSFLDDWIDEHSQSVAYTTALRYKASLKHINQHLGHVHLQSLNAGQIQKMYRDLGETQSSSSIAYIHTTLNLALKSAIRQKLIAINPCDLVVRPKKKPTRKASFIPPEQLQAYLDLFKDSWIYPAVVISIFCGLRRGEILALRWRDVDLKKSMLSVNASIYLVDNKRVRKSPKNGKTRTVNIPQGVNDILKAHKKNQLENRLFYGQEYKISEYVITESNGTPPRPDGITQHARRKLRASDLDYIRFHDLRHTAASLMLYEGNDIKTVSDILGHSSIRITADIYAHVMEEKKKQAAESLNKYL